MANAMNKANAQPHPSAVNPAPMAVANAALIATVARKKAHALKAQTHKPTCRSKA